MSGISFKGIFKFCFISVVCIVNSNILLAQEIEVNVRRSAISGQGSDTSANFELAARFAPYKISELVHSTGVDPHWIKDSEKFWYQWDDTKGTSYYLVDPLTRTKTAVFDNDRMAAELTELTKNPWDGQHLPINNLRFLDEYTVRFDDSGASGDGESDEEENTALVRYFELDLRTQTVEELSLSGAPDNHPDWASISPDGQTVLFAKEHNLWMMTESEYAKILQVRKGKKGEKADEAEQEVEVEEIQLTTDGVAFYSYASNNSGRGETNKTLLESYGERNRSNVTWSKDSKKIALVRPDQRNVDELWVIHAVGNDRPELESYKYDMPGEENVTQNTVIIYDLEKKSLVSINDQPWQDQMMSVALDRTVVHSDVSAPQPSVWLSDGSEELWVTRTSRDRHRTDVLVVDAETGSVRVVIEERMNTYLDRGYGSGGSVERLGRLKESGDLLWWSERDGWGHIYRYGSDGTLKSRLTEGPWHVDGFLGVDEASGHVFLRANGREEGEDPYYQHLYRVNLDGSDLVLLNPGNFDHQIDMSTSKHFFVDNYSRVNTVPVSALYDASGQLMMELEQSDFSSLMDAGYVFPEPYKTKSADGITDIYGVMYKPYDFDSERDYPIVAYVYPGPQTESVSKSFSLNGYEQGLAQFGFIVVTMGNRGGHPDRSKWYHNYGYGNLRDYGLADKKSVLEQLGDRHDFIDLNKIGIYGHSGGGFMSTAAMLVYPDFFKVAVSSSGNHNNDVYNRNWSETHHGVKEVVADDGRITFEYDIEKNSDLAENLKGHLLLTTGDIDNNVHHAGTFRVAEALIKANKRFDFFMFPGQRHGYGDMGDYWFWLRAEYFVRHLLGDYRWNADIMQLQVEKGRIN